jgi:hypothetical protein
MSRLAKPSLLIPSATLILSAFPAALFSQAATKPASPPDAKANSLDPATDKILDRLEARGKEIKDIEASLVFVKTDPIYNATEKFEGTVLFKEDKPNPRFLICFDRSNQNGRVSDKKEWHVFDGRWYIEAREKNKTIIRREVLRPDENREVFRLGQGPFPLPFGQKKADILKHFAVKLIAPAPKDPPDSDHLELTPLPGTDMDKKYEKVHFFIDRKLALPSRVQTVEKDSGDEISATFSTPKLNQGLAASRLDLPRLEGYGETEDRLPPKDAPPAMGAK